MREVLSFEGEVLNNEVHLSPSFAILKTEKLFECIHKKFRNQNHANILIHTKGATSETSDKFYKFFFNGKLKHSSYFNPKKILGIPNALPNEFHEFFQLKVKIYMHENSFREIFTLNFHFFDNSTLKNVNFSIPQMNPMLNNLLTIFEETCSKVSIISFQFEKSGLHLVDSVNCDVEKMIIRIKDKFSCGELKLKYSEMEKVSIGKTYFEIIMVNSEYFKFYFDLDLKKKIFLFFNFLNFILGLKVLGLKSTILIMDVNLVLPSREYLKYHREHIVEQRNYLESIFEIEENVDYQLSVSTVKFMADLNYFYQMVLYFNGKCISEQFFKPFELINIDLKNWVKLKPNDEIELRFFIKEELKSFGEVVFEQKIKLQRRITNETNHPPQNEFKLDCEVNSGSQVEEIPSISHLDIRSWKVDHVCKWIKRLGSTYEDKRYDKIFRENRIDGNALINMEMRTLKELGVNIWGHRFKILNEIKKLK
jgi:hypothetical protein